MEPGASAERWRVFILLKSWESLPGVPGIPNTGKAV